MDFGVLFSSIPVLYGPLPQFIRHKYMDKILELLDVIKTHQFNRKWIFSVRICYLKHFRF
jgi:hypothetical protein